jgi:hypothetical protein
MKTRFILFPILLAFSAIASSQPSTIQEPRWKWARTASDAAVYLSVTDTIGNIVSVGTFSDSSMYFGSTAIAGSSAGESTSMFIAKYNTTGGISWAQSVFGLNSSSQVKPVKVVMNDDGKIGVFCKISNITELKIGKYSVTLKMMIKKCLS